MKNFKGIMWLFVFACCFLLQVQTVSAKRYVMDGSKVKYVEDQKIVYDSTKKNSYRIKETKPYVVLADTQKIDGVGYGRITSKGGVIRYWIRDQKDTLLKYGSANANSQDDVNVETGRIEFAKDGSWKYYINNKLFIGDDSANAKFDFQSILEKAKDNDYRLLVRFDDGNYNVYGPYRTYSYTTIYGQSKKATLNKQTDMTLFINCDDSSQNVKGYNGAYYLFIHDLTVNCNKKSCQLIKAAHAEFYTFKDLVVKNGAIRHVLELNAMKNVTVQGCSFENLLYDKNGEATTITYYANNKSKIKTTSFQKEVIQIEGDLSSEAWPTSKTSHDTTACTNIYIKNNNFKFVLRGIGNHTPSYVNLHKNIVITGNTFQSVVHDTICLPNGFSNVTIKDNKFKYSSSDDIGGKRMRIGKTVKASLETLKANNLYWSMKYERYQKITALGSGAKVVIY